jgi:hypothetical protein
MDRLKEVETKIKEKVLKTGTFSDYAGGMHMRIEKDLPMGWGCWGLTRSGRHLGDRERLIQTNHVKDLVVNVDEEREHVVIRDKDGDCVLSWAPNK